MDFHILMCAIYFSNMIFQAFAAAGNLLLFGDERLPAGSAAAVEVAKATQCDHNPPKGRGGGDMTSDTSSSSSSSSGASSSATTDLVSRLGIMGGSYTDLSASGTARGLLYSQVLGLILGLRTLPMSIYHCEAGTFSLARFLHAFAYVRV